MRVRYTIMYIRGFILSLLVGASAAAQIHIGAGSIAEAPPENKGTSELFARSPRVEDVSADKPLPTSDWWTDLLWCEDFPGKMWAYPLTLSANSEGVQVWYPKGWSENGQELTLGEPLLVRGVDPDPGPAPDRLLFDFEGERPLADWSRNGKDIMRKPARFNATTGALGRQMVSSFTGGDAGIGEITSPAFLIDRDFLHLRVSGGDDAEKLGVHLMIDGQSVAQALGEKSNVLTPRTWDVRAWKGQQASLQMVDTSKGGWGFTAMDHAVLSNSEQAGVGGVFQHASTVTWGDWSVQMRLNTPNEKKLDVTFGRGLPLVWIESEGLDLEIPLGEDAVVTPGQTPTSMVIAQQDRYFGVFVPSGSRCVEVAGALSVQFGEGARFLVVAALPAAGSLAEFERYAYAVPRDTRFDWQYSPKHGKVVTTWTIEGEALAGSATEVLQGWIPHHYRVTQHDLTFNGLEYVSRRGRLRLAPGNLFHIVRDFHGLVPLLPLATDTAFKPERLAGHITAFATELLAKPADKRHGADTYWGGKSMIKNVNTAMIAGLLDHPQAAALDASAKEIVTDWLTYTPGEKDKYYARYPAPWKGLVGFNPSFGSEKFTDNHFHYGYLTYAAAMVAAGDAEWKEGFGDLATEVARQYANWDRAHADFPYLRSFEPWVGHSYAGGLSNGHDGNNQESSSEAMQSWAGLFLLGTVLGNDAMRDCGAMGYAVEGEAVQEYWYDSYGWNDEAAANYPAAYEPTLVSVVRDRDIGAWTWFSGKPLHIYGIQWLPNWTTLHYLGRNPEHAAWQFDQMMVREGKGTKLPFAQLDNDWGHVAMGYLGWCKPEEACAVLERAYDAGWPLADDRNAGHSYYLAHANRALKGVDWTRHTDLPTSLVFKNGTVVAWNPAETPRSVTVYEGKNAVGQFEAKPNGLTTFR